MTRTMRSTRKSAFIIPAFFRAPLSGTQSALGSEILAGGLLAAVAEKVPDITAGAEGAGGGGGGFGMPSDWVTQVSINSTNETVRSIFTDCLPAADYHAVMWTAVTTKRGNLNVLAPPGSCVMVHFFGPRKP